MLHALVSHADSSSSAVDRIDVRLTRHATQLVLQYTAHGRIELLNIPAAKEGRRADDLWQHTCFELFVRAPSLESYYEFNFSPSTEWAAYRFDAYRSGMTPASISAPTVLMRQDAERVELRATLDLASIPDIPELLTQALRLGLAVIVEEQSGGKSYWALSHSAGRPDFHHVDCFSATLPAG